MTRNVKRRQKIVVRVLGATEIRVGTRLIELKTEVLFALALYMTTRAGELVSREELLEVFWPEGKEEDRRHAMRQMFYRLRQVGIDPDDEGDGLRLDPGLVDSDVVSCLRPSWIDNASANDVENAARLQCAFSARMPAEFLDWFDGVRSAIGRQCTRAAMFLLTQARSQGRWSELEHWARTVLRADPLNEEAILALAEATAMSGSKSEAIEILDSYLAELGDSSAELQKPAMLLRKRIAERRISWSPASSRDVGLVGRAETMALITSTIESVVGGHNGSLVIVGPSGFGKSRLLAEAVEYASLRGLRVLSARVESTVSATSLSLVRELVRQLLALPGAAGTDPSALSALNGLVRGDERSTSPLSFAPLTTTHRIHEALAGLIAAVSDERKLLILVDDLQNADADSFTVVSELIRSLRGTECALVIATQPSGVARLSIGAMDSGPLLAQLSPLGVEDAMALADATATAYGRTLSAEELASIASQSGGHPLFARELAIAVGRSQKFDELPASLRETVNKNLAKQTPPALHILRLIALLGPIASVGRVQALANLDERDYLSSLESLSADGVVQLDKARVLRLHDSWREAVLAATSAPVCSAIALSCARAIESESGTGSYETSRRLGDLYRLAGDPVRAIACSLTSIDSLLRSGLYAAAVSAVDEELKTCPLGSAQSRLLVRRSVGLHAAGLSTDALQVAEDVWRSRELQSSEFLEEHLLAVGVAADCHTRLDMADSGPANELLAIASRSELAPAERARACLWGIRLVVNAADQSLATEFDTILRALRDELRTSPAAFLAHLIVAAETGTADDISEAHARIEALDLSGVSLADRTLLLRCSAHAMRIAGRMEEGVTAGISAYQLALRHGLEHPTRVAAELLCHTYLDWGRLSEARTWLDIVIHDTNETLTGHTATSRDHLRDRFAFLEGEDRLELLDRVLARLPQVRNFGRTQGRSGELSLAAAVTAEAGRTSQAAGILEEALKATERFSGRNSAEFALDMCLRAERVTGGHAARDLSMEHLRLRAKERRPPVPIGLSVLKELE